MYHTIKFLEESLVDLEISPKQYLEKVLVPKGAQMRAQIRPYVLETGSDLLEVADLYFDDGTTTRAIPFEHFEFVD